MDDLTMEEKCENLMNIVVESRKKFGKMCVDYEQKTSLMENKILNLQLETISSYRFKPKQTVPNIEVDDMTKDTEEFTLEIISRQKRIENLKKRLKNTQDIVLQLKSDNVGRKLRQPLTAEALLTKAKSKHVS
ncbi:uncharacterized protein LOC114357189 [Ostrinia furnacalis]|uniref:uncharacterized protein LOC114357189 n=1 Tax=Ostrinia furnacalis TaxID=93504 RepID=UPI00103DFF67|nr:uncharacterized protein LOC114357189 [Ostrinia furnacalis]